MRNILLLALLAFPTILHAEPAMSPQDKARQCFKRGVELYDERDLDGAEVEFRRAYELTPNFRLLFNLGQVAGERHDYAKAMEFFRRYLREGGDEVPTDRKLAVETELGKFRTRVGGITVRWDGPTSEILIDDEAKGKTSMGRPIEVNVGRHRIELRPMEGEAQTRMVDVPGGDTVVVVFWDDPSPTEAKAITANRPSAEALENPQRRSGNLLIWTSAAITAVGATVAGILAYNHAKDLRNLRESYPVSRESLDDKQRQVHYASWTADGLIATTVILATIAIFRGGGENGKKPTGTDLTVGSAGPWSLQLSRAF